jgi:hypothetical protein
VIDKRTAAAEMRTSRHVAGYRIMIKQKEMLKYVSKIKSIIQLKIFP